MRFFLKFSIKIQSFLALFITPSQNRFDGMLMELAFSFLMEYK